MTLNLYIYIFPIFYFKSIIFIYGIIIVSVSFSLFIGLYYQIICFLTEPGIIPRNYPSLKIKDFTDKIIYSKTTKKPIIRIQRNCAICSIRRPKKCQHCYFCDNCIEEFDHHCLYVSNCIGKRNRKFFFLFISFDLIFLYNGQQLKLESTFIRTLLVGIGRHSLVIFCVQMFLLRICHQIFHDVLHFPTEGLLFYGVSIVKILLVASGGMYLSKGMNRYMPWLFK